MHPGRTLKPEIFQTKIRSIMPAPITAYIELRVRQVRLFQQDGLAGMDLQPNKFLMRIWL